MTMNRPVIRVYTLSAPAFALSRAFGFVGGHEYEVVINVHRTVEVYRVDRDGISTFQGYANEVLRAWYLPFRSALEALIDTAMVAAVESARERAAA